MRKLISNLRLVAVLLPAHALLWGSEVARYPILPAQVAQALSNAGMDVKPEAVSFGARVVASKSNPQMNVLEIHSASGSQGDRNVWVRIGCREVGVCLPFYATVAWDQPLPKTLETIRGATAAATVIGSPPTIRCGAQATLMMENDRARLDLSVVTLESGYTGQVIRVATTDRKRTYRAEVVGATLLKGAMQP